MEELLATSVKGAADGGTLIATATSVKGAADGGTLSYVR